jgi:hypothetical protein
MKFLSDIKYITDNVKILTGAGKIYAEFFKKSCLLI